MGRLTSWLQDAAIKIGPILPSPMTSSMRDFGVSRSEWRPDVRFCGTVLQLSNTDLRKFLDTSVSSISGHIAGASYRAGEAGAQATAQSERTKPVLVANRFHAISQASMMSAKLRNTELASQWLRR